MDSRLVNLPLQAAQKSMLLLEKIAEKTTVNHRSAAIELKGSIDQATLITAFDQLIQHHPLLSAQVTLSPSMGLKIPQTRPRAQDLVFFYSATTVVNLPPIQEVADLLDTIQQGSFFNKPFELEKGPLFRIALIECAPNHYYFVMLFHHIIVDETSIGILCEDLSTAYNALRQKIPVKLPQSLPLPELAPAAIIPDQPARLAYWEKQLTDLRPLNLVKNHLENSSMKFKGDRFYFSIPSNVLNSLPKQFSLNVILLGVFYTLLSHYADEKNLWIAITSANRRLANCDATLLNRTVNCFFNTLPIAINGNADLTFENLLDIIKQSQNNALKNQLPVDTIIEKALSAETKKRLPHPAPTVMLVLNRVKPTLTLEGVHASRLIEPNLHHAKMPYLALNFDEQADGSLEAFLEYSPVFTRLNMELLAARFQQLLNFVVSKTTFKLHEAPLLLPIESEWIAAYNDQAQAKLPLKSPLIYLQTLAETMPQALFLKRHESPESTLTYGELFTKVQRFIHHFSMRGILAGDRVGICLPRSPELYAALFALWQLGATVIPLSTENKGIAAKIALLKPRMIVANNAMAAFLPSNLVLSIQQESIDSTLSRGMPSPQRWINQPVNANSIAYILTTSGTTSTPKAVAVPYRTVMNLLVSLSQQSFQPSSRILCTAIPEFDPWFYNLFVALVCGGTLHLTPNQARYEPLTMQRIIDKEKINFAVLLPTVLANLNLEHPMHVISMGAVPNRAVMQRLHDKGFRIENGYGPTEAGIELTRATFNPAHSHTLIGKPLPASNMRVLVVNPRTKQICPIGVPGEIYAAGPGLALGYLDQTELTAERFPTLPDGKRYYATGDLACYQHLGDTLSLQYLGRKDGMVRLHGLTVDPDHIATILREHPRIKDIAIVPNPNNTVLWAYVVTNDGILQDDKLKSELRKILTRTDLPGIAYPRLYQFLPALPLTENGKLDKSLLKEPMQATLSPYLALTPLQREVLRIFAAETQNAESETDIHATYKELGGDSIRIFNIQAQLFKLMDFKELPKIPLVSFEMTVVTVSELLESMKPFKPLVTNANVLFNPQTRQLLFSPPASMLPKTRDNTPRTPM